MLFFSLFHYNIGFVCLYVSLCDFNRTSLFSFLSIDGIHHIVWSERVQTLSHICYRTQSGFYWDLCTVWQVIITQSKTGFPHRSWSRLSAPSSARFRSSLTETSLCETPGRSRHYAQVSALVWLGAHSSRASSLKSSTRVILLTVPDRATSVSDAFGTLPSACRRSVRHFDGAEVSDNEVFTWFTRQRWRHVTIKTHLNLFAVKTFYFLLLMQSCHFSILSKLRKDKYSDIKRACSSFP